VSEPGIESRIAELVGSKQALFTLEDVVSKRED